MPDANEPEQTIHNKASPPLEQKVRIGLLTVTSVLIFVLCISVLGWLTLKKIESEVRIQARQELQTVLTMSFEAMHLWIDQRLHTARNYARDPELLSLVESLVEQDVGPKGASSKQLVQKARDYFQPKLEQYGDQGFFIISRDLKNLASMRNQNLGKTNLISLQRPKILDDVFNGQERFVPTIRSDVPLSGKTGRLVKELPTLFIAVPIFDLNYQVIAALAIRLDPAKTFTRIAQQGRLGESGETYAFDRSGRLITESRFEHQLRNIGMIRPDQSAILSIVLTDPGTNLLVSSDQIKNLEKQPLTVMAQSATRGESGFNVSGYRDYRGVEVVGAWSWDEKLNFGMTTEIDSEEIFGAFRTTRTTVVLVLLATMILGLTLAGLLIIVRKKGEQKLHQAFSELEQMVNERTKELKFAEEKAVTANRAKDIFLANMSHEIRTPLNAVIGYAQIILLDELNPGQRKKMTAIQRSGNHLLALINEILDLSKIEAGVLELTNDVFDLALVLKSLDEMFSIRCEKRGLTWDMHHDVPSLHFVSGDKNKISQILINLIGNAVKFTTEGTVSFTTVRIQNEYRFVIKDTGPGILPEELKSLFTPFQQASAGELKGGTGLGLSISKGLSQLMNGDIILDSNPGVGTTATFSVTLPKSKIEVAAPTRDYSKVRHIKEPGSLTALVVDDIMDNRELLEEFLVKIGLNVLLAENGQVALETLAANHCDIVFMDIRMPVMDGITALKKIQERYIENLPVVVAVTASSLSYQKEYYFEQGFKAFIGKPFELSEIIECLEQQLAVEYQYAEDKVPVPLPLIPNSTLGSDSVDYSQAIDLLPKDIRQELLHAAELGQLTRLKESVGKLKEIYQDKPLSDLILQLEKLLSSYEFNEVVELLTFREKQSG